MKHQEDPGADEIVSQNTIFDILSSSRRRMVLALLREANGAAELTTLTERIAARETGHSVGELPPQARKRVYVSLYQTHLPRLKEAGLVHHDAEAGTIRRADRAAAIDPYLAAEPDVREWAPYYLLLALFGVLWFGATSLNVAWIRSFDPVVSALGLLVMFLVLVLLHLWSERHRSDGRFAGIP